MSIGSIFVQIFMVCLVSFGIGTLMEWYKKKLRGDKASVAEIRIIAGVLSVVTSALLRFGGLSLNVFGTLFPSMGATLATVLNIVLYAVAIFILQMQSDMKLLKSIIKLVSSSVTVDEIAELLANLTKTTGITTKVIANFLSLFNLTDDKIISVLLKAGVPEADAVTIMVEIHKALGDKQVEDTLAKQVKIGYEG